MPYFDKMSLKLGSSSKLFCFHIVAQLIRWCFILYNSSKMITWKHCQDFRKIWQQKVPVHTPMDHSWLLCFILSRVAEDVHVWLLNNQRSFLQKLWVGSHLNYTSNMSGWTLNNSNALVLMSNFIVCLHMFTNARWSNCVLLSTQHGVDFPPRRC